MIQFYSILGISKLRYNRKILSMPSLPFLLQILKIYV